MSTSKLILKKDGPCYNKEDNIFYFCPSYLLLRFMGTVNVAYYLVSVCAIIFSQCANCFIAEIRGGFFSTAQGELSDTIDRAQIHFLSCPDASPQNHSVPNYPSEVIDYVWSMVFLFLTNLLNRKIQSSLLLSNIHFKYILISSQRLFDSK